MQSPVNKNASSEAKELLNFLISNSIIIDSGEGNTLMYTDWLTSYANNNWWGANEVPRDRFRVSGSYKIITDTWVIWMQVLMILQLQPHLTK